METAARVAALLGGVPLFRKKINSWSDLDHEVRSGLPKRSLQLLAAHAVGSDETVGAFIHKVVPPATFKRRTRLSLEESQRTERLARIFVMAESFWPNPSEARAFIYRPHPLLSNQTPLEAARTELGARRVEELLYGAAHGLCL